MGKVEGKRILTYVGLDIFYAWGSKNWCSP